MKYKIRKDDEYSISVGELRQLLYWAAYGVKNCRGGSYQKTIIPTIRKYADDINFAVERKNDPLVFERLAPKNRYLNL